VPQALAREFELSAIVAGDQFFAFLSGGMIAPCLPEAHAQNEVITESPRLRPGGWPKAVTPSSMTGSSGLGRCRPSQGPPGCPGFTTSS